MASPSRPKKGAAQFVAAQPGSRQGGTRRRGEVSKDVIRRFTVPQISGPFHQLESRVLGGQISRPAATAEVATRFPLVCGAANDHPTPSQASTNRYAGSKDGRRDCGRSRSTAPAPTAPIGPQSLRSHNLARSSANSFLSGGSAGYPLPRGGARFCFEASPICLHRRYANNVLSTSRKPSANHRASKLIVRPFGLPHEFDYAPPASNSSTRATTSVTDAGFSTVGAPANLPSFRSHAVYTTKGMPLVSSSRPSSWLWPSSTAAVRWGRLAEAAEDSLASTTLAPFDSNELASALAINQLR